MLWFSTLDYAVDSLLPTCGHGIDVYEQMYTRPFFLTADTDYCGGWDVREEGGGCKGASL